MNYKNLEVLIKNSFSGDVSIEEVSEVFLESQMQLAESFLIQYPEYIKGIPYKEDDDKFDNLLAQNHSATLTYDIIKFFD